MDCFSAYPGLFFLFGKSMDDMTPEELGERIRAQRTALGLTQREVASYANVGERFVVELEAGKPTLQLGKVLRVLATLGLRVKIEASP